MVTTVMRQDERGTTLIEVMIASAVLCTLMAGLMSMATLAISTTENQGHLAARATEYAQDKMEQLLALSYGDQVSDTRTFPAASSGGTGLKVGGSYDVDHPTALYVDYLDDAGNLCGTTGASCLAPVGTTPPSGWFYKRVWKVDDNSTDATLPSNLKRITVAASTSRGFGGSTRSTSYLTALKSSPF
jgi:prepilin-type N-terminal cleavage/methylation domain-containing protein